MIVGGITAESEKMNTVEKFFEKVLLNEFHNIRIKSAEKDSIICEFNTLQEMERSGIKDKEIVDFATDWDNKIYILWI